jgi:cytochrome P450
VWVGNPEDAKRVLLKHGNDLGDDYMYNKKTLISYRALELFPKVDIQKSTSKHLLTRFLGGPNVATLNGQAWKSQRMVTNPAFRRSMPVKVFGKLTQDLFAVMETMDPVVNLTDLMQRWTLEVIGRVGFGKTKNKVNSTLPYN